jgi:hypothetical protein
MSKDKVAAAIGASVNTQNSKAVKEAVDELGWEKGQKIKVVEKKIFVEVPVAIKMCRPTIDIPKSEYDKIHALCRKEGTTIKKKLYEVISKWLEKAEKSPG